MARIVKIRPELLKILLHGAICTILYSPDIQTDCGQFKAITTFDHATAFNIMELERFDPEVRYMIVFDVLSNEH